ncbi:MAG: oligosaccharide flippase family protein [Candidatus Omnitrophica bacterium]|nr:oligosaccharide flippase family protein [Candidatus Omnitrophota bacterium]
MQFKSRLLASSSVYLGTSILDKLIPFLLLPILTRYLEPRDYGTLAIFTAIVTLLNPVIGAGLPIHIQRNFFKISKLELAKLMSNMLVILSFSTLLGSICLIIYSFFGASIAGIPVSWVFVILFMASLSMIFQLHQTLLRNEHKVFLFGAFQLSYTATNLILSLILVVLFLMNWEGRALAMFGAALIFGGISFCDISRKGYFVFDYDKKKIKEILKISLPLIPHTLGMMIIFISDRFFIDQMVGKSAVGIYAVGYSFGMIVGMVTDSFNKSWSPWIHEKFHSITDEMKLKIVRFTYLYQIGIVVFALIMSAISIFLLRFMTAESYHGAAIFIPWIALGYAMDGMYKMVSHYLIHLGKTNFLGFSTFFAASINLILNYFLIKANGAIGAAQATLIAYVCTFSITWWYARRIYPMPWFEFKKILGLTKT